jgi:hypothetical protein
MKIDYLPADEQFKYPRYFLRPEETDECRFLTLMRDLALRPNVFLQVVGTEDLDTAKPGLPARAVMALILTLHGDVPDLPPEKMLDPNWTSPQPPSPKKIGKTRGSSEFLQV